MKISCYSLTTILLLSSFVNISYAKNYPIYAGIGTSFKNYEFSINDGIKNNTYFKEAIPSIKYTVGYIGSDNKFSVSLFGDNIINNGQLTPVQFGAENTNAKLKRDDYGVNVNYNLTDKISILGGYRYGKTSISYENSTEVDKIKTYGPYIGGRYLLYAKDKNRLFSSLNYSFLSTDFSKDGIGGVSKFNFDGKGYALSLGWSHYLGNNNSLYIAGEYHNYDHDKMKNSSINNLKFSLDESAYSARVEFIHSFK